MAGNLHIRSWRLTRSSLLALLVLTTLPPLPDYAATGLRVLFLAPPQGLTFGASR
ncbi:MAG: hypothetical protein JWO33_2689 [Caulobacteraceae bacterium]|nr:hypothetical protein [Caulobacteraceae bacterium]